MHLTALHPHCALLHNPLPGLAQCLARQTAATYSNASPDAVLLEKCWGRHHATLQRLKQKRGGHSVWQYTLVMEGKNRLQHEGYNGGQNTAHCVVAQCGEKRALHG